MQCRNHHRSTFSSEFRPPRLIAYGTLIATVLLAACSTQSAWRSSSALSAEARRGAGAADVATSAEQQPPHSTDTVGSRAPESGANPNAQATADTAAATAESSSALTADGSDASAAGGNMTGGEEGATGGNMTAGEEGAAQSGLAGESAMTESQASGTNGLEDANGSSGGYEPPDYAEGGSHSDQTMTDAASASTAVGESGAETMSDTHSALGESGQQTSAETADAGQGLTGATGSGTSETAADAEQDATVASDADSQTTGTQSSAPGADVGAGERAGGLTGESGLADSDAAADAQAGQSSASGEGGTTLAGTDGKPDEVVVGMVETPGKKAVPTETVIPQTLGGLLPMTLGVEGEGEFDFDKAVLREQVRSALDELVSKLEDAEYDRLEIIGYADRIGTEEYNQYLSERRAWAVARYLMNKGVPVSKLAVEGRGMRDPLTSPEACAGLGREDMIRCMQPDRRVVISASIRRAEVNVH